jgi:hypothetical protein
VRVDRVAVSVAESNPFIKVRFDNSDNVEEVGGFVLAVFKAEGGFDKLDGYALSGLGVFAEVGDGGEIDIG